MRLTIRNIFAAITCFGTGAGIGLMQQGKPQQASAMPLLPETSPQAKTAETKETAMTSTPTPVSEQPAVTLADTNSGSPLERLIKMTKFVQTASVTQLADYVTAADDKNDPKLMLALTRWLELEPEQALASNKSDLAWWCYGQLDANAALAAAEKAGENALSRSVYAVCQADPARGETLLEKYPKLRCKVQLEAIVHGYAKQDAAKAARFALENGVSLSRPLDVWMASNPRDALAWAATLEDPAQKRTFMDQAAGKLVRADPLLATEVALEMKPGEGRTRRIADAAAALIRRDPVAAQNFLKQMPEGIERDFAGVAIAGGLAGIDAAGAQQELSNIDWTRLSQFFKTKQTSDPLWVSLRSALTALVSTVPEATAEKLFAQPEANKTAASLLMRQWASVAPEQASAWVDALPMGEQKDLGIRGLNRWLTQESAEPDFNSALYWTHAATEKQRWGLYIELFSRWYTSAPEQALEALEALPVTPQERSRIQSASRIPSN